MSGALQPFHEQESHGLNTLTVTIDDQRKWLLKVNRVDTTDGAAPGVMLLSEIFPPELRIVGLTNNMTLLEQPTERGTTITLQGFLYLADRNFYVRDVSVAAATAQEIQEYENNGLAAIVKPALSVQETTVGKEKANMEKVH